ncbi:MAG: hypothetical protein CMO77_00750 [Verrucomicrobiales bacterium]|nr:hypothetical protein [Verrucomicrobiales bacterium]
MHQQNIKRFYHAFMKLREFLNAENLINQKQYNSKLFFSGISCKLKVIISLFVFTEKSLNIYLNNESSNLH